MRQSILIFIVFLIAACQTTHNPDSINIEQNSWNRKHIKQGIYTINVRGNSVAVESLGFISTPLKDTPETYLNVDKIYSIALKHTCTEGVKSTLTKENFIREVEYPSMLPDEIEYPSILPDVKGMVFGTPWIQAVVQCNGSELTYTEANEIINGTKVHQSPLSDLMEDISDKMETKANKKLNEQNKL